MTYIPDLAEISYSGRTGRIRAVGWLEHPHPYVRGPVEPEFEAALLAHARCVYGGIPSFGIYFCSLCEAEGRVGPHGTSSQDELLIPASDCLYEAPIWIVHYVKCHEYRPPDEYRRAVLACPSPGSREYALAVEPYISDLQWMLSDGFKPMGKRSLDRMLKPSLEFGSQERMNETTSNKAR